jgi:predicted negative regulator of RcsB-dependent stress response
MSYETEEQQVEAIKKWWKDNGTSVIGGVVIGLGVVFGFQWWNQHQDQVGAEASNLYDQLVMSVRMENAESAAKQKEVLQAEFGATPYAGFADLVYAKLQYENGDSAAAEATLRQAVDSAANAGLRAIAVLRLSRVLLDSDRADEASALLDKHPAPAAFAADYAVLRGDLARSRGDYAAARGAYQEALAGKPGNAALVQLKLDNLPPAG